MRSTTKKFFGAAVFQKCCRGVGEQPTFAEQMKLYDEKEQKSKSKSEESQLLLKLEGCKYGKRFQGQLRFPGKLGICPSLADPDSGGFSKSIVSKNEPQANKKFFGAAILQKCCRGVGEQPTFAKQIKLSGNCNKNLRENWKNRNCLQKRKAEMMEQGFMGNCDS